MRVRQRYFFLWILWNFWNQVFSIFAFYLFHEGGLYHKETSPLYMIGTSVMKEIKCVDYRLLQKICKINPFSNLQIIEYAIPEKYKDFSLSLYPNQIGKHTFKVINKSSRLMCWIVHLTCSNSSSASAFNTTFTQQTCTCWKSTIVTLEKGVIHV